MRTTILAGFGALCLAAGARADDTKPPQISDVRAGVRVEASPMMKSDLDDTFRVSFPGNPQTEYWIEASDLLGNGPSTYGSAAKPVAVAASSPKGAQAQRTPAERREHRLAKVASKAGPPVIEHRKPGALLPEGK